MLQRVPGGGQTLCPEGGRKHFRELVPVGSSEDSLARSPPPERVISVIRSGAPFLLSLFSKRVNLKGPRRKGWDSILSLAIHVIFTCLFSETGSQIDLAKEDHELVPSCPPTRMVHHYAWAGVKARASCMLSNEFHPYPGCVTRPGPDLPVLFP